jgi:pimeloyl-ACP methyl ester carboxylesterase
MQHDLVLKPRVYILIHGSFHGGWCWHDVAAQLEQAGCRVECPDLIGVAGAAPAQLVSLQAHIDQVTQLSGQFPDHPVTLVGHSYAGMVLPAVAAAADNVDHLIYLDAFTPYAGESAFMLLGDFGQMLQRQAADNASHCFAPPPPQALGVTAPEHISMVEQRLRPMHASTHEAVAKVSAFDVLLPVRSHYILCEKFDGFYHQAARAQKNGWPVTYLRAGHDAMISDATIVATTIMSICS